jgi:capsular exopolysaccharide synthesis family protein
MGVDEMSTNDNGKPIGSVAPPPQGFGVAGTETLMRNSIFLPNLVQTGDQGPPLPSGLSAAPTAGTLWRAFIRVAPLALFFGILTAGAAVAVVYLITPPKYPVSVLIKVNSSKPGGGIGGGTQEDVEFSMLKSFQMELVKSREVINKALEMQVKDLTKGMKGTSVDSRFVKELPLVQAQGDPVDWLQGIKAEPHLKSQEIIVVSGTTRDRPEDLTIVMNALGKALEDENQSREEQKHHTLIEQAQAKQVEGAIRLEQRRKLLALKTRNGSDDELVKKHLDRLETQLSDNSKTLGTLRLDAISVESQIKSLTMHMNNADLSQAPPELVNDLIKNDPAAAPLFLDLQKAVKDLSDAQKATTNQAFLGRYFDAKLEREKAIEDYKFQNRPAIQQRYREKVLNESSAELRKLKDRLGGLKEQERAVGQEMANAQAELDRIKPNSGPTPEVVALKNEIEALEKAQGEVTRHIALLKVNVPQQRVSVYQNAIVPGGLDYSRFTKLAGAGGIGGFLIAVLAVSFREFRWRKICTGDEVSRGLGLSLIGSVPSLPDSTRSPLAGQGKVDPLWQNQLIESVDTIRTLLLHNARANNTRVIMVSSAVGGEGKTTLASQLAASLARAWKKTLLIDGDLRSPSAHKLFEVPQEPGLCEILRGELNSAEAIRSTPLSRLWIIPAGHWDSHAVQALAQDSVRTLLEELKQQYDFIVLDSSPILPVADALLLGQNVDGVLLTVMRDLSRAPALYAAHQRLEGLGIKTLGAVMMGASSELGPLGYKYAAQARR